tara:strand:+ start:731 stop:1369 length:639 start_codon:yes stop_codon:yes gene_type:complete
MCGRYELKTNFINLPDILKKDMPVGLSERYEKQTLIKPGSPILVLKNEGKTQTSIMLWGFISEWSKDPFDKSRPKPFNARSESVEEKKLFRGSWRHKRCLIPASGFLEKGHLIRRKDSQTFWLGGLWSRWMSQEGSEIESCCVLTTKPNELVKQFHNRMPVVIPNGLEEEWISSVKSTNELKGLKPLMNKWNHKEWKAELINQPDTSQLSLL